MPRPGVGLAESDSIFLHKAGNVTIGGHTFHRRSSDTNEKLRHLGSADPTVPKERNLFYYLSPMPGNPAEACELVFLDSKNAPMWATLTTGDAPRMASCVTSIHRSVGAKGRGISFHLPLLTTECSSARELNPSDTEVHLGIQISAHLAESDPIFLHKAGNVTIGGHIPGDIGDAD